MWQSRWTNDPPAVAHDRGSNSEEQRFYLLDMLPYTSGELHIGHARLYTIGDALTRYRERLGCRVLHPIGWDAFGLPTDIAAQRLGTTPPALTQQCIAHMKPTLQRLGTRHDWSTEINTSAPEYYRWTQWLFLRLYEVGLAYRAEGPANWCPDCETVLANEQAVGGRCERCGALVQVRNMPQWFLRITRYADALVDGLDDLPGWADKVKRMQRNWIGRESADGRVTYRLRDWSVSRQRYWGAPVPIVYCPACGMVAVPDDELPVMLPPPQTVGPFTGEPLAQVDEFVNTQCPRCGRPARRDTETLDTFVDSAWYFLRYVSPRHNLAPFCSEAAEACMPVDLYLGGVEHAILHLLYARFFCRALHDIGLAPCPEPFQRLFVIGMVLHKGAKMSKSRGNVVDAASVLDDVGADVLRLALLFAAPAEADVRYDDVRFRGMQRLLARALRLPQLVAPRVRRPAAGGMPDVHADRTAATCAADRALLHKADRCIHEVTRALEETYAFNVAIASLAALVNAIRQTVGNGASPAALGQACCAVPLLLAPFAPHAAEELWHRLGGPYSVHAQPWPRVARAKGMVRQGDQAQQQRPAGMGIPALHTAGTRELPVQIDGKLAARIAATEDMDADQLRRRALAAVSHRLGARDVVRVVVVPGKIVNVVTARARASKPR